MMSGTTLIGWWMLFAGKGKQDCVSVYVVGGDFNRYYTRYTVSELPLIPVRWFGYQRCLRGPLLGGPALRVSRLGASGRMVSAAPAISQGLVTSVRPESRHGQAAARPEHASGMCTRQKPVEGHLPYVSGVWSSHETDGVRTFKICDQRMAED